MFFTDISWKAKATGALIEPFDRWTIVGLSRASPSYVVHHSDVDYSDTDTYMLLAAGTESLVSLLCKSWAEVPKVYVLAHDRMIPVDELWSYRTRGRKPARYYAWKGEQGELVPCESDQPPLTQVVERVCLWKSVCGMLTGAEVL
jgi:hypothetical protein